MTRCRVSTPTTAHLAACGDAGPLFAGVRANGVRANGVPARHYRRALDT